MATKNGARYLRDQIDSILPQLDANDELVITDDCSVDETVDIINSYIDARIKLTINTRPKGIAANFETSLRNSSGTHIFLADQDDVWLREKIQIMMAGLQHADLVICDCDIANDTLDLKHRSFFNFNGSGKGFIKNIIKNSYMGCCMAFTRQVMIRALPFPDKLPVHDLWIGLIGEMYFNVQFIPRSLLYYRRHDYNASSTAGKSTTPFVTKINNRFKIIWHLVSHKSYAE